MFHLFSRIVNGLDPVAEIFKKHVDSEGMKRVKQAADAVEEKKGRDTGIHKVFFSLFQVNYLWIRKLLIIINFYI